MGDIGCVLVVFFREVVVEVGVYKFLVGVLPLGAYLASPFIEYRCIIILTWDYSLKKIYEANILDLTVHNFMTFHPEHPNF